MSACIKLVAEKRDRAGSWERIDFKPEWYAYDIYGVLADQRNYACAPVIAGPRHVPEDWPAEPPEKPWPEFLAWEALYDLGDGVKSWLSMRELLDFDYDQTFTNCRPPDDGQVMTVREHLGDAFFDDLQQMQALGVERIVFRIG